MMCRSGFVRKLTAILLSVLMIMTYSVTYTGTAFAGNPEKFYKDSTTGLTYLLDAENHTADVYDIDSSVTTVNIPEKITVPDGDPNAGEYTVTELIPKKNHSTGSYYPNVTTLTLPGTIKTVRNVEFRNVKDIVFPASVETIDGVTIGKNSGPEEPGDSDGSVTFEGNSLTTLYNTTFNNTKTLKLPDSLTTFLGRFEAKYVTELTIPGSVGKLQCQLYCKYLEKLTIGEGITEIARNLLLADSKKLEEIVLPESLSLISESWTFSGLDSLKKINIPAGTRLADNAIGTFSKCKSLTDIELPAGFFQNGVLPSSTFSGCSSLTKVTLAEGGEEFRTIDSYAFSGCYSLTETPDLSKVTNVGDHAFDGCRKLTKFPDLSKVTSLGTCAFSGCRGMTGEADLSNFSEIPDKAFKNTSITGVKFSDDLYKIGAEAFYGSGITKLDIPNSVTEIGKAAFAEMWQLTDLKIGNGVERLQNNREFANCKKLKSVEIGTGIGEIGDSAFDGCNSIESAVVHAASDEVSVNRIGNLSRDQIVFDGTSIGDVGDTIAPDSEKTLQQAVNEAGDGGTVVIKKNIRLSNTLTIPEGKTVTIRSEEEKNHIIWSSEDASLEGGTLIEVGEGRGLVLRDVTVRGRGIAIAGNKGLVNVSGRLTLEGGAGVREVNLSGDSSAAVRVSGQNAVLNMKENSFVTKVRRQEGYSWYVAPVRISGGAQFFMEGGTISENDVTDRTQKPTGVSNGPTAAASYCSSGVYLSGGSMKMKGGMITRNTAHAGSAVFADAGSSFVMSGGSITKNKSIVDHNNYYYNFNDRTDKKNGLITPFAPGAVYVGRNSSFDLNAGLIEGNSGRVGGGVAVDKDAEHFTMNGGTVNGNTASNAGGGIYTYSVKSTLKAGSITGNNAYEGGGVYSEGNIPESILLASGDYHYSHVTIENALITGNKASKMGGGIWTCPTGRVNTAVNNSIAVFDNKAESESGEKAAGDDFAITDPYKDPNNKIQPSTNNLTEHILGGGKVRYYQDGRIYQAGGIYMMLPSVAADSMRYGETDPVEMHVINDEEHSYALKTIVDNEDVKTLAKSRAKLVISGNTATYGGGVGCNGGIKAGGGGEKKIHIEKKWEGDAPVDSVKIGIYAGDYKIETVTLGKDNNWTADITGLPQDIGRITAVEENVAGYEATVEVSQDENDKTLINVTVTNSRKPDNPPETEKTEVSVEKVWKGDEAKDRPESISVQLLRDGKAYGDAVTLSEANSWSYKWTDLDKDHEWSVEEVAVPEGYNSVTSHDGNSWIITNTKTEPENPGGDNPRPVNPDEPNEPTKPSGGGGRTTDKTSHGTEVRTPGGYYVVRTGDSKEALIYTGLFTAAAAGAVYVSVRRRKKAAKAGR